jgi:hypothetical protein
MTAWTSDELDAIAAADELRIAPRKPDGTLRGAVPIWVVRQGDDLYVRSFKGGGAAWYRGTQATHTGHIESGGVARDVTFADETDPGLGDALDAAYRAKYRNYSASIVNPMLTEQARDATLRLVPR